MKNIRRDEVVDHGTIMMREKQDQLAQAKELDAAIRWEVGAVQTSLSKIAEMFNKMREENLWTYLVNPETEEPYRRFDEYISAVTGDEIAHTKLYDLLAIGRLSSGSNPVPSQTIEALGRVKAAAIARLAPEERTPELLEEALARSVPVVRQRVQEILNKSLPPDERRDTPIFWGRYYPEVVVDRFEQLEARGCFMQGIRDGIRGMSLKAKFMFALVTHFETNYQEELAEADAYIAAMKAKKTQGALTHDDEEEFGPPEPEDLATAISGSSEVAESWDLERH